MSSVKVGNAEIISFLDIKFAFPCSAAYPSVPEVEWVPYKTIYPECWQEEDFWATNAQAFLVRSGGQNVLVDTGVGPGPHEALGGGTGNLLNDMRSKGVDPASINLVVLTHMHFDHTGWAAADAGASFPGARIIAPEADFAQLGNAAAMFADRAPFEQLQQNGKLELVSGEKSIAPELTLLPTPGHTPGHQSLLIASAGERAIILGDVINHPAQVNETDWNAGFDFDQDLARQTRKRVLDRLEQDQSVVAAGHYPHPGLGRIVRAEGRRIFQAL